MRRLTNIVLGAAVAAIGVTGCSGGGGGDGEEAVEDVIEEQSGGDVDVETGGDVPDCFPDAPVPDGEVQAGFGAESGDDSFCTFAVEIDGGVDDALDDYRSALEDDGWEVAFEVDGGATGGTFGVTKGDQGISAAGGQTGAGGAATLVVTSGGTDVGGGATG